jgi:hypothetical protein
VQLLRGGTPASGGSCSPFKLSAALPQRRQLPLALRQAARVGEEWRRNPHTNSRSPCGEAPLKARM